MMNREGMVLIMVLGAVFISMIFVVQCEAKSKKTKQKQSSETNVFNFFRIFIMRLVYGFASMFGGEEALEDFMGGAFVPPGVDDADYRDYFDNDKEDGGDYY